MGLKRRMVMSDFTYNRFCEADLCKNKATVAIGKEGGSGRFKLLLCDSCLKEFALLTMTKYKNNDEFKQLSAEAFGSVGVLKGTPVKNVLQTMEEMALQVENMKVEVEMYKQADLARQIHSKNISDAKKRQSQAREEAHAAR
jgi:hypothetical protein